MKFVEEKNGPSGSNPEYGAIFMSSSVTKNECLRRGVFGLPVSQASFVEQVKAGMLLFLFEFECRQLHGVFQASSDGSMNIVPSAFYSSGKQFPAQVKVVEMWQCGPLYESEFRDAIKENYFSVRKFNFGLSEVQVRRLLTLFSFKKLERSPLARSEVAKPTEFPSSIFNRGTCISSSADGAALEHYGDVHHKLDLTVTSPLDALASRRNPVQPSRLTAIPSLSDEPEIEREFDMAVRSEDTSEDFGRVSDHRMLGIRNGIGNEFSKVSSFRTDASTIPYDYFLSDIRRIPENLRYTPSDRSENEYRDSDGFAQVVPTRYPSLWSNLSPSAKHRKGTVEADTLVLDPPRPPQEPLYTMNTKNYDPSYPTLHGNATIASAMPYGPDLSNVDSILSSASAANRDSVLRVGFTSCGGSVNDTLSLEKVQSFPPLTEHDGSSNHMDVNLGRVDYIPLSSSLHEYPTRSSMIAAASSENVSIRPFQREASRGRACHLPLPNLLTSTQTGKTAGNYKSLAYSSSPSILHPPFVFPLSSQDKVDLSSQDRLNHEIPARQSKKEFGGDASGFNNKWGWLQDHVSYAERESQKTRSSVFTRLALPPKECHTKRETSLVTDPVDEVMGFLHECEEGWMKKQQSRLNTSRSNAVRKFKTKKQESHVVELLEDNSTSPIETALNVVLACDESVKETAKKPTFINFRRRSEIQKTQGNLTQGCKDSIGDPSPEKKKRKLVRPKLSKEEPSKEKGTSDNPFENDAAPVVSVGENKVVTCEVPVMISADMENKSCASQDRNTNGHNEQMPEHERTLKKKGTSDNPIETGTSSCSITFVGESTVGTCEVSMLSSMDMESKSCPSQDGKSNRRGPEMPKHEEAKEDALILCD